MRRWASAIILGSLLTGCAPVWVQENRHATPLERDTYECKLEGERVTPTNTGPYGGLIYAIGQMQYLARVRQVTNTCMQLRGYTKAE